MHLSSIFCEIPSDLPSSRCSMAVCPQPHCPPTSILVSEVFYGTLYPAALSALWCQRCSMALCIQLHCQHSGVRGVLWHSVSSCTVSTLVSEVFYGTLYPAALSALWCQRCSMALCPQPHCLPPSILVSEVFYGTLSSTPLSTTQHSGVRGVLWHSVLNPTVYHPAFWCQRCSIALYRQLYCPPTNTVVSKVFYSTL